MIDEANIGATIVALRAAAAKFDKIPEAIRLVEHDEKLQAYQWRRLAIEHLERQERKKQQAGIVHIGEAIFQ